MTTRMVFLIPLVLALLTSLPAIAGVFVGTVDCTSTGGAGNFCAQGRDGTLGQNLVPERAIMHPPGWDGTQSIVDVKVCVNAPAEFIEPTQRAIATWNALTAAPANCPRCLLVEQIDDGEDENRVNEFHAESVILHELGHCALGLGHSNLLFDDPRDDDCNPQDLDCEPESIRPTSFSASYDGVKIGVQPGPDGIRGTKDDRQDSIAGTTATSVHWFRTNDNDPVVIDGVAIDKFSFAVDTDVLPSGSNWPANANRASAAQLGVNGTQAVMYSNLSRDSAWFSPSADDVNMVQLAKTGVDVEFGGGDDYSVNLTYVESCTGAQVMVRLEEAGIGALAGCDVKVFETPISPPPPLPIHYTIAPGAGSFSTLVLDDDVNWNTGSLVTVFDDDFESGDTSAWSGTVP